MPLAQFNISRKTWLGILITGCIAAVLLTPMLRWELWFLYFRTRERVSRVPFEPEAWKGYRREFGVSRTDYWSFKLPVRLRMIDDLMTRQALNGKARTEVVAMRGEKVETQYFQEWDLVYFLGPGRYGNAIGDSEWLVIRFDPDGRVSDYRVVHD